MATKILRVKQSHFFKKFSMEEFIENLGSGTLRKNTNLGFLNREQYIHERLAWEYGGNWLYLLDTRLLFGNIATVEDTKVITEAGWFADRFIKRNKELFPKEDYKVCYINITFPDNSVKEGIALVARKVHSNFLTKHNHTLFALIAECKNDEWQPCMEI